MVSTADLIAARTLTEGLARLRGHGSPARTDLLDGLVAALITDDLEQPLPWTDRGPLTPGAHPVVAEMVGALSGDRVSRSCIRAPRLRRSSTTRRPSWNGSGSTGPGRSPSSSPTSGA